MPGPGWDTYKRKTISCKHRKRKFHLTGPGWTWLGHFYKKITTIKKIVTIKTYSYKNKTTKIKNKITEIKNIVITCTNYFYL